MVRRHIQMIFAGVALALAAAPAAAQFSESYNFLKAVRDADGDKATKALQGTGVTIVNTRDYSTGESALAITIKRRDMTWTSFLLGKGANPNIRDNQGNAPLHSAAMLGFTEGAELLIKQGAQVNLANNSGETPLIIAVQQRDLATVRLLLNNGANPKLQDRIAGKSARDYAADDPRGAAVLKLIDQAPPPAPAKPKMSGPGL